MVAKRGIFDDIFAGPRLIQNRDVLHAEHVPSELPHRDEQIHQMSATFGLALKGLRPENLLVFGKTGTGKTAAARFLGKELEEARAALAVANTVPPPPVRFLYVNCKLYDTDYVLGVKLCHEIRKRMPEGVPEVPPSGWTLDRILRTFAQLAELAGGVTIVCLDEVDNYVEQTDDDMLYILTEMNEQLSGARLSLMGISNSARFLDRLDDRVRVRVAKEQMVFPPYDARQLQDILEQRSQMAFVPGGVEEGVIPRCAALAAAEHGDARRAIDLLRVAGEHAEREGAAQVAERHVDRAAQRLGVDILLEVVRTLPTQAKIILWAATLESEGGAVSATGIEAAYQAVTAAMGVRPLKLHAISRVLGELAELDVLGEVHRSAGRRTKLYRPAMGMNDLRRLLGEDGEMHPALRLTTRQSKLE